jgi:hypothetical protein
MTAPKIFGREMERFISYNTPVWRLSIGKFSAEISGEPDNCWAHIWWTGKTIWGSGGLTIEDAVADLEAYLMRHLLGLAADMGFEIRRARS